MEKISRKLILVCITVIYILAAGFSTYCLTLKRDALQFQTRDYNYFIEQAARLADRRLANHFTVNIDGYNFLGVQGTEGVTDLFQAIHTEYFRYTYTLLYLLTGSTLAIYIFYCLIFFAPIPYFAFVALRARPDGWKPAVLFALLYLLLPAMLNTVTAEIRPRMLFIAAWSLLVLAIVYGRPFREKLAFFLFLFSIREESILLGAILIAFNFFAMRSQPGQRKQTLVFLALDGLSAAAFLAFMAWGGYTTPGGPYNLSAFLASVSPPVWAGALAGAGGVLALTVWIWRKRQAWFQRWMMALVYAATVLLTGLIAYRDTSLWAETRLLTTTVSAWDVFLRAISGAQDSLFVYIAIPPLALLWNVVHQRARMALAGGLIALCVVFAGTSVVVDAGKLAAWSQASGPARLVWDFKQGIDRYKANVLLDYATLQAFYDVDKIAVYNRLPLWMVSTDDQRYPKNKQFLVKLIKERVEYIVIARNSLDNMTELIGMAGVPTTQLAANEAYVILKLK